MIYICLYLVFAVFIIVRNRNKFSSYVNLIIASMGIGLVFEVAATSVSVWDTTGKSVCYVSPLSLTLIS